MADYSFVVPTVYQPFTLQEMLTPFQLYGEAYNKAEEQSIELQKQADNFSYLADTLPEGSKARAVYENYANDLKKYGDDLSTNGLSISNRRGIANMRRRYSGEIGRLDKADTALQEERKRRLTLNSSDPTTLYANDNLSIDDFLDRKQPNTYSVSGQKLYERGVQIGASDSSRIWNSPQVQDINNYYQNLYSSQGRDPQVLTAWRHALESIPELNESLNSTLKEYGVTDNLTGANYERAKESVINGIINGSSYKKVDNIQKNLGVLTYPEQVAKDMEERKQRMAEASVGLTYDKMTGNYTYNINNDLSLQREIKLAQWKNQNPTKRGKGKNGSSSSEDSLHRTMSKHGTRIEYHGEDPKNGGDAAQDFTTSSFDIDGDHEFIGPKADYDKLPEWAKKQVDKVVGNGAWMYYDIYYRPFVKGAWQWDAGKKSVWNDTEAGLEIVPRVLTTDEQSAPGGIINPDLLGNMPVMPSEPKK